MSVRVKTLYADATEIEDPQAASKLIAPVLGVKAADLAAQLAEARNDEKRYVPLAKGLDEDAVQRINRALDDPSVRKADEPRRLGLHWREGQRRSYPYQSLAAHVIGISDADGVGQAGIERSQNERLFGAVIKKVQERDRLGRVYDETISEQEQPKDVVLTIDMPIQFMVEQSLSAAVTNSNARSGSAIVIDNRSGEILAMANYPSFDPNKLDHADGENISNATVQKVYAPGSVFKLITYSSALERQMISPTAEIDSGSGQIDVAGHLFRDSHAIGRVSYTKAFAHSSNVCAIKTGMRVGRAGFYEMVRNFGFGTKTGIELPAETAGIVRAPERWNGDSLASMSIGYEIGVTPLQIASAFATIANSGVRIQPHIIKEIRTADGQVEKASEPASTQVVSPETARDMTTMMRQVVLAGTGKRARLNGYSSAGKTGTAWKFDEKLKKVSSSKYMSSFIGFAPAENPAVTIAVVMDEPKTGGRDGGQAAGPVFREIAQNILPALNIQPTEPLDDTPEVITASAVKQQEAAVQDLAAVPDATANIPAEIEADTAANQASAMPDKPALAKAQPARTPAASKDPNAAKAPPAATKPTPKLPAVAARKEQRQPSPKPQQSAKPGDARPKEKAKTASGPPGDKKKAKT